MADYDSADCLARLRAQLGIGTNTADSSDASLYILLSNGQRKLYQILATHVPWLHMSAPTAITSSDSGVTYNLPSSSVVYGHIELYDGQDGPQLYPLGYQGNLWDGYVLEGGRIRFPGNRARTFANGLYCRYTAIPSAISAASEPTLEPDYARQAIVYEAAIEWCTQGGAVVDPRPFKDNLQRFLWGDPNVPGDVGFIGAMKTSAHGYGRRRNIAGPWWKQNFGSGAVS